MGNIFTSLFKTLFGQNEIRILIIGLDAAGKSTILYKLKLGEVINTIPTIGFNVETIIHNNITFTMWDLGGGDKIKPLWRHYYQNVKGLIFVVDSNDRDRIGEAKDELMRMLGEPELKEAFLLIFANKQDLSNPMNTTEIIDNFQLDLLKDYKWFVQTCSAVTGSGLYEGLDWLSSQLQKANF